MLKFYNTLTREKEEFTPVGKAVTMYSCGPTVYNYAHIGNLRTYVFMDLVRRTLRFNGYKLKGVMNITDVGHLLSDGDEGEDKMAVAAKKLQKSPYEIAEYYTEVFFRDIERREAVSAKVDRLAAYRQENTDLLIKLHQELGIRQGRAREEEFLDDIGPLLLGHARIVEAQIAQTGQTLVVYLVQEPARGEHAWDTLRFFFVLIQEFFPDLQLSLYEIGSGVVEFMAGNGRVFEVSGGGRVGADHVFSCVLVPVWGERLRL